MVVVALVVAIPVTLLIRSDAGDPAPSEVGIPALGATKVNQELGVKLKLPRGWRRKSERDVLKLRSKDSGTRIAISAPGPAGDAERLYRETLDELRGTYRRFKVLKERRSEVGGLRSRVAIVRAMSGRRGDEVRLLVSTAPGEKLAYLVVVATSGSDSGRSLVEAQAMLNELKLIG